MTIYKFIFYYTEIYILLHWEAVVQRCSVKEVFLEISQKLQENISVKDTFLIRAYSCKLSYSYNYSNKSWVLVFSSEFCKISQNTFFSRAPAVAATVFHVSRVLNKTLLYVSVVAWKVYPLEQLTGERLRFCCWAHPRLFLAVCYCYLLCISNFSMSD